MLKSVQQRAKNMTGCEMVRCACFYDILLVLLLLLNPFLSLFPLTLGCVLFCVYPHDRRILRLEARCIMSKKACCLFQILYIYSCAFICVCLRAVQIYYLRDFAYLITVMSVSSCAIFQNDLGLWAKEHLVKSTRVSTDIEMGMRWKCLWRLRYV